MIISRPHTSPEEVQKTRERLGGKTQPTAALASASPLSGQGAPLLTPEQQATAAANLKARADARGATAPEQLDTFTAESTAISTIPVIVSKKGTKVPPPAKPLDALLE